ncbi:hypothetical protein CJ738_36355, partial [Klebsiella pneumoniae]
MGWQVILHTGVTTRSDLLQRFLQLSRQPFPPADFSWLAAMGWQVILHTGVTTRSDLLQRFLQLSRQPFPPA